jgi:hypothetical protein
MPDTIGTAPYIFEISWMVGRVLMSHQVHEIRKPALAFFVLFRVLPGQ